MNRIFISGNVVSDPVVRSTQSGKEVCSFRVAVNEWNGKEEVTTFFDCSAWEKLGATCQKRLEKGSKVSVLGKANTNPYIGKDGKAHGKVLISVQEIDFHSKKDVPKSDADETGIDPSSFADISPAEIPF